MNWAPTYSAVLFLSWLFIGWASWSSQFSLFHSGWVCSAPRQLRFSQIILWPKFTTVVMFPLALASGQNILSGWSVKMTKWKTKLEISAPNPGQCKTGKEGERVQKTRVRACGYRSVKEWFHHDPFWLIITEWCLGMSSQSFTTFFIYTIQHYSADTVLKKQHTHNHRSYRI